MRVYLDGKDMVFGDIDMESISESVLAEQKVVRPKSYECTLSFKIGYGIGYVDDERRKYWSKNWKQVAR